MTPEQTQTALDVLDELAQCPSPTVITEDERAAIVIVRDALKGVAAGDVLEPFQEGNLFKLRQVRRVDIRFVHPDVVSKAKQTEP